MTELILCIAAGLLCVFAWWAGGMIYDVYRRHPEPEPLDPVKDALFRSHQRQSFDGLPGQKSDGNRSGGKHPLRAAADAQARAAEYRGRKEAALSAEGTTRRMWVDAAARRLKELWFGISFEDAVKEIEAALEMSGMVFPDPGYDWSLTAARDFATEYAQENGEAHGKNS